MTVDINVMKNLHSYVINSHTGQKYCQSCDNSPWPCRVYQLIEAYEELLKKLERVESYNLINRTVDYSNDIESHK